jgi:hypothetical protein
MRHLSSALEDARTLLSACNTTVFCIFEPRLRLTTVVRTCHAFNVGSRYTFIPGFRSAGTSTAVDMRL